MQSVLDILPSLKFPEFCIFEIFRAFRGSGQTSRVGSGKSAASGPGKQPSCAASTSKHSFFSFFFFSSSGGWVKIKLKLPHFQVGLVSMSTRPDPEGSGTVEIATRRCPRLRVVWDLRELTHKNPGHGAFPPDLAQLRSTLPVGALVLGFVFVGPFSADPLTIPPWLLCRHLFIPPILYKTTPRSEAWLVLYTRNCSLCQ